MVKKKDMYKKAAALKYTPHRDTAPRLVAKGSRKLAERIIATAKAQNIPLKEDPQLIEVLSTLDLYEEIPPSLYKAVAEVLVFVYKMNNRLKELKGTP